MVSTFRAKIEIHTDGDFSCKDSNYDLECSEVMYFTDTYKEACRYVGEHLEEVKETLNGRQGAVDSIKKAIDDLQLKMNTTETTLRTTHSGDGTTSIVNIDRVNESLVADYDCGNHGLALEIGVFSKENVGNAVKYVNTFKGGY